MFDDVTGSEKYHSNGDIIITLLSPIGVIYPTVESFLKESACPGVHEVLALLSVIPFSKGSLTENAHTSLSHSQLSRATMNELSVDTFAWNFQAAKVLSTAKWCLC